MLEITQARPDEYVAALTLAYQRVPPTARQVQVTQALQMLRDGALRPAGVWIAREAGVVWGVQIVVPLGGASCLFWLPETRGTRHGADELVQAALQWCAAEGNKLAHLIVPAVDTPRAAPLLRQGFRHITRLLYMEQSLPALPTAANVDPRVRCVPYTPAVDGPFRATLVRSYHDTLDCPELNGLRTVDEILAGYRGVSTAGTAPWWLVLADDTPAGVVILTALPEGSAWDLSYLGVLPEWRRRGIGRAAAQHALHAARAAGAARLLLAVDERNGPARELYEALGFIETEVREVYLHFLGRAN